MQQYVADPQSRHMLHTNLMVPQGHATLHGGETHCSFLWVIEPLQQLYQSALATPTGTHQSHSLTHSNLKVQPMEYLHIRSSRVLEDNVLEFNISFQCFGNLPIIRAGVDLRILCSGQEEMMGNATPHPLSVNCSLCQ